MNIRLYGFAALFVIALSVMPAHAQRVQPKAIGSRPGSETLLAADAVEKLKLTEAQKDKYTKVETDYKDKVKAVQEKYRTDIAGLNDRAKVKEAGEDLRANTTKAREDHLAKIEPILDADQKKLFAQIKLQPVQPGVRPTPIQASGAGINPVLPPALQNRLQLSDDQKKQIDALQKEVEAKILKVLTDEQKKTLEQLKKRPALRPQPIQPAQPRVRPAIRNSNPAQNEPRKDQ